MSCLNCFQYFIRFSRLLDMVDHAAGGINDFDVVFSYAAAPHCHRFYSDPLIHFIFD